LKTTQASLLFNISRNTIDLWRWCDSTLQGISQPSSVVAHQYGTCRFGEDQATSVLDLNCRAHDVHNLYVVDSSFFPSHASVSPGLTVIANALRVGDRLIEQLK
jgi:choline dehydrogenase-like flavoprotein